MSACIIIIYISCLILLILAIILLYIGIDDMVNNPNQNNAGYSITTGTAVSCASEPFGGWGIFKKFKTLVDYNITLNKKTYSGSTNIITRDETLCNLYNSPTYKFQVYYDPNNIELTTINNSKQTNIIKIAIGCALIIIILMLLIFKNKICGLFE